MSNSGLSCDVCNRENVGITFVNGMKFCAKCYQETFGSKITEDMLIDMIKKTGWTLPENKDFLTNIDKETTILNQQRRIAELEEQLAEKEKKIEKLREGISQCEADRKCEQEKKNLAFKELRERSEQLRSQPAEIVEKIKEQIFNHFNVKNMEEYENLSLIDSLFTADAVTDMLDDVLKDYQK